jgi:amino acid adenylation domain-containing protein
MQIDAPDRDLQTIHGCFSDCARRYPHAVAIRSGDEQLTYAELDALSDSLAAELHAKGIGPGHVVPVLLPRSPAFVATLIGILKAGAAYAALDASWPAQYLDQLLSLLPSPVIVSDDERPGTVTWRPGAERQTGLWPPTTQTLGRDACCVFFSSGTTDRPKAALVPHNGTVRLFRGARFASLGPGSAMPQAAPLSWDGLTLELWSMLLTGGTSILLREAPLDGARLRQSARQGATLAWITASLFNLLVEEDLESFSGLRQVLVGGERLSPPHVRRFLIEHPGIRLTNGYGPAEATVFVSTHDISIEDCDDELGIPLGTGLPDTGLAILDGDRPCQDAEPGELCVYGPRLALRYLGSAAGGFVDRHPAAGDQRLYRTGDLVLRRAGCLYFVGRADRQVKVLGHRLELPEVEAAAMRLPGMRRCVALPVGERGTVRAVALFYSADEDGLSEPEVRQLLPDLLPSFAMPGVIRRVRAFALTANGKLDERAMLASLGPHPDGAAGRCDVPQGTGDLEQDIAAVMLSVLGTKETPADVPLRSLGASSLDLMRFCMRLENKLGLVVPPGLPYRNLDIRGLAGALTRADALEHTAAGHDEHTSGELTLPPQAAAFLVQHQISPHDTSALCPMLWDIQGPLDIAALDQALRDVAVRHDCLGAIYKVQDRATAMPRPVSSETRILTVLAGAASLQGARERIESALCAPALTPATGRNWRAFAVRIRAERPRHLFGIVVHHLAFDGWSESVLATDLARSYNARLEGRLPTFPSPAPGLADIASARERRGNRDLDDHDLAYWQARLTGSSPLRFSAPSPVAGASPSRAEHLTSRDLTASELEPWGKLAAASNATLFPALLTVYSRCLAKYLVSRDIVVGVPLVVRETAAEESAIGCLINMLPLRINDTDTAGWDEAVAHSARAFEDAFQHRHADPGDIAHSIRTAGHGLTAPIYETVCVLQNNVHPSLNLSGCVTAFTRPKPAEAVARLVVEYCPADAGGLRIEFSYQVSYVPAETAWATLNDVVTAIAHGPSRNMP